MNDLIERDEGRRFVRRVLIWSRVSDGCATVECIGNCAQGSIASIGVGIIHTDLCVYS